MTEHFTDADWRRYQDIPEQGYSHRHWLNHHIDQVLQQQRQDFIADIASSRPVRDGDLYRDGIQAGIDRAIYRIQHPSEPLSPDIRLPKEEH